MALSPARTGSVTLLEAADQLGVHYMTAYRYVRTGRLAAHKQGTQWQVAQRDLDRFVDQPDGSGAAGPSRRGPADHTDRLVARLVVGDEAGAWTVVQRALAGGLDPDGLYLRVLGPAMHEIGRRWEAGQLSVAHEHQASAVVLRLVGRLGPLFSRPGRSRGTVVLGAPAGDHHSLAPILFGDLLRGRGLAVVQLGGDTPAASFVEAALDTDRLVAVGVATTLSGNEEAVAQTVAALHRAGVAPVVAGGRAVTSCAQAEAVGADHHGGEPAAAVALFDGLAAQAQRDRRRAQRHGPHHELGPAMTRTRRWLAQTVDLGLEATVALSFCRLGYQVRHRLFAWPDDLAPMTDRVVLVTGATSGLGRAVAGRLASAGATVVITGRDPDRTRQARRELVEATANAAIHDVAADLARLDDVAALADRVLGDHPRLDGVIHNAGALVHDFTRTPDGLELTVQTHVVAPFLLTRLLLDRLAANPGPGARVVSVASGGMYTQRLADLDLGPDGFDGVSAYAKAKRAQVVLSHQWARRTAGSGVTFHAMHPGWVDTPGLADALPGFHRAVGGWLRSPDEGGDTIAWLASDPGVEGNGHFWLDRHRRWVDKVPWTISSETDADDLWRWVSDRAGIPVPSRMDV